MFAQRLVALPAAIPGGYTLSVQDVGGNPAGVPLTDAALLRRIFDAAALLKPDRIVFVQGTPEEDRVLKLNMQSDRTLIALDPTAHPNSFLHRSRPTDTARVTDRTFVASKDKTAAGPLVNWKDADEMRAILNPILDGAMRGKTMYVLCGILGPDASPHSKLAIQITDSPYVVANVTALYGVGEAAFDRLNKGGSYSFGVHASSNLDREKLFVARFTDTDEVVSVNSAYGGNAILFKKAIGLGTASARARREGWMAEHMALIELENPAGDRMGIAVCKPSASGKTNDAMMNAEITALGRQGWKVRTISDDIVYMHVDEEGYLRAIPIERGFFGVAPGTSERTNPNVMATLAKGD